MREGRPVSFYLLGGLFALFVLFLYGPMITIVLLSFQGPEGGLTFPMQGVSTHWFRKLWSDGLPNVDIWSAFARSFWLGLVVMVLTVVLSLLAGLAYRKRFAGSDALFYVVVASLITAMSLFTSALGAHLTWTLPFGLLIMFAIFNRFDNRFEEAARDLGASPWQTLRHVVLPIIGPSVVGIGLFGFTLSWDEIARTSQAVGYRNTLPLELQGQTTTVTTPVIYALGTLTTAVSFAVIGCALAAILILRRRQARLGSDAGKGLV
jgi:putative spermidine/putrescine transport system permease protein